MRVCVCICSDRTVFEQFSKSVCVCACVSERELWDEREKEREREKGPWLTQRLRPNYERGSQGH